MEVIDLTAEDDGQRFRQLVNERLPNQLDGLSLLGIYPAYGKLLFPLRYLLNNARQKYQEGYQVGGDNNNDYDYDSNAADLFKVQLKCQQLPGDIGHELHILVPNTQNPQQSQLIGIICQDSAKIIFRFLMDPFLQQNVQVSVTIPVHNAHRQSLNSPSKQFKCYCWISLYGDPRQLADIRKVCQLLDMNVVPRDIAIDQYAGVPLGGASSSSSSSMNCQQNGIRETVTQNHIIDSLKNLQSDDSIEESEQPAALKSDLFSHQKMALTFMKNRESGRGNSVVGSFYMQQGLDSWLNTVTSVNQDNVPDEPKGGILADDMGLGKTLTVISLILCHPFVAQNINQRGNIAAAPQAQNNQQAVLEAKATLIICPVSVISSWQDQLQEHVEFDSRLDVLVYHGKDREKLQDPAILQKYDVILTTYETVRADYKKHGSIVTCKQKKRKTKKQNPPINASQIDQLQDLNNDDNLALLDEAVQLGRSQRSTTISDSDSDCRDDEAEDGNQRARAPLERHKSPLFSLRFHRIVLDEAHYIRESANITSEAVYQLKADRRWCLTGTPIVNKLEDLFGLIKFLRIVPFSDEKVWRSRFSKTALPNANQSNYYIPPGVLQRADESMVMLRTLMKCIMLRRTKDQKVNGKKIIDLPPKDEQVVYIELSPQERKLYDHVKQFGVTLFKRLVATDEVMRHYTQILEIFLRFRQICTHSNMCDGKLDKMLHGSFQSFLHNNNDGNQFAFSLDMAKQMFMALQESGDDICSQCMEYVTQQDCQNWCLVTRCSHLFCSKCADEMLDADANQCPACDQMIKLSTSALSARKPDVHRIPFDQLPSVVQNGNNRDGRTTPGSASSSQASSSSRQLTIANRVDGGDDDDDIRVVGNDLDAELRQREDIELFGLVNDDPQYNGRYSKIECLKKETLSAKFQYVLKDLLQHLDTKSVIFSQWTTCLNILEHHLNRHGVKFTRLDGQCNLAQRQEALQQFKNDQSVHVLIMSLKAGGVGINLTCATRVYLMDIWWAQASEQQAIDRVHRLGQTHPVTCIRVIVSNSIEENVLNLQKRKAEIAQMALSDKKLAGLNGNNDGTAEEDADNQIDVKGKGPKKRERAKRRLDRQKMLNQQRRMRVEDLQYLFTGGNMDDEFGGEDNNRQGSSRQNSQQQQARQNDRTRTQNDDDQSSDDFEILPDVKHFSKKQKAPVIIIQ
ncbi:hypothetical protein MP228_005129 [Amoeboaphelidium protococcarum]|nr:hypothetical protein MP228_005129 [Amoeboaphelidium protococcarum]